MNLKELVCSIVGHKWKVIIPRLAFARDKKACICNRCGREEMV